MDRVEVLLLAYRQIKFGLEQSIPFSDDWLHLLVGPVIFVATALLLGRPGTGVGPWLAVVLLAVMNEVVDITGVRLNRMPFRIESHSESFIDLLLTISIPTILLLVSLLSPASYRRVGLSRRQRR